MKVVVKSDAPVLIPNKNHRNFTQSGQTIEAETILEGEPREIRGLRKGRPFIYKFFVTKEGQLIHLKKVEPMNRRRATEVTLGADEQRSATVVNVKNASSKSNKKYIGAILGAGAALGYYAYRKKYKKKTMNNKSLAGLIIVGGLAGFGIGYYMEGGVSKIKVDPSK